MDIAKLKKLITSADITIKEAMQKLNETAEKILFVADNNDRLIGSVTDGDIRRAIINNAGFHDSIANVIQRQFTAIKQGTPEIKEYAKRIMLERKIEQIPVLDDHNVLVDIMLWTDILGQEVNLQAPVLKPNYVVIMAGGKGTRLAPFTKILPKPLIPLGEKPIVEFIMDRFYEQGFHRFKLVINHKKEMIKLYFRENKLPYEIELLEESEYCGTVGGLYLLKGEIKSTFILTNCDTLLEGDYGDFLNWHQENKNQLTIIGAHKEVAVPYGVLQIDNGALIDMIEKPQYDLFVNTGTYVMEPEILDSLGDNESLDIDELIIKLKLSVENKIGVFPCWGRWSDIGQWDEYKNTLKNMGIES